MVPVAIQSSTTMVGRDAELSEIAASLGVRPLRPATKLTDVLLSGDAGVGKTRLLRALRDLAVADGWQVFAGHCLDFGDSALPYLPFSEVVGRLVNELPDVVAEVAANHPALTRLQPVRRVMSSSDSTDAEASALDRADLFRAFQAALEAAATRAPVLLVIEDTHWADQSTRDMLSFLLSRIDSGGFAIVASYRSDDLHRRHPLRRQVAEWSRLRGVDRIALSPLADDAVRALVAALVPGGLPESELADVIARAEGNAFFVEELTSAAAEPGSAVPGDLADVLLVRLDRLADDARQVVRTASASGRRVTHDMLEATSDLTPDALDEGLRGAVEMNVLVPERGGYAFRHALLGEAVYDDLLPGERARLHARYVLALQEITGRGSAAELARHARLAMDKTTALTASVRAGNEASEVGGPDEAAFHYQQALEILSGGTGQGRPRRPRHRPLEAGRQGRRRAHVERRPRARGRGDPGAARPPRRRRLRHLEGADAERPGQRRLHHRVGRRRARPLGRAPSSWRRPARVGCGHGCWPTTRRSWPRTASSTRPRPWAWTPSSSPSVSTSTSSPPTRS